MKRINLIAFMLIGTFCLISGKTLTAQVYYNDTVRVHAGQTSVTAKDSILRYLDKTYTNNYISWNVSSALTIIEIVSRPVCSKPSLISQCPYNNGDCLFALVGNSH